MEIKNRELTIKLSDLIDAIESVETEHTGDQDEVRTLYKTDLLRTLGFISCDAITSTIEEVKELIK